MKFRHFRIFLTVLASFGPFFAYFCRLNLSLIIEEIVVKPPSNSLDSELDHLDGVMPRLTNEERTLAELSTSNWWVKKRALLKRVKLQPAKAPNQSHPIARAQPFVQVFAFNFDVRGQAGQSSNPTPPSNASNQLAPYTTAAAAATTTTESSITATRQEEPSASSTLKLNWSKESRNELLTAYFVGYVIFQVPAGRGAEVFGAKFLFLCMGLVTGLSSLIFPFASRYSDSIVFAYAVRFIMGAAQAGLFPTVYVLLCQWLPKKERSSWLAVPSAMGRIGTIVMNSVVPLIMLNYDWEWVFYASGLLTLAWTLLFAIFGSDSPSTSGWLSHGELIYIESRIEPRAGQVTTSKALPSGLSALSLNSADGQKVARPAINWVKMLRSKALLILAAVMFTSEWSNMLLLVKLPGFLGPALKMNLNEIGLWSSILTSIYCVQYPLAGILASRLEAVQLDYMSSLRVRKLFELIAHALQATCCLAIATFNDKTIVLASLVVMMFGRATVGGGQCLMPPELSKDYPGSVMAVANSIANVAGIIGPKIVDLLVSDPNDYASWRSLWLLSGGIFIVGGALFCLLAENRPQNYCKKPKLKPSLSTSEAQLVLPPYYWPPLSQVMDQQRRERPQAPVAEERIPMDSFARVSSEPQPQPKAATHRE